MERARRGATVAEVVEDQRLQRIRDFVPPFRVPPGSDVVLSRDFDSGYTGDVVTKEGSKELLKQGIELLDHFQSRLAAQDTFGLLVVLQALDAGGKDGTIRHVMSGVNPQGVVVHGFKVPSPEELDHDFLWRYARRLPARGEIGIFNRSHYEEVLVVRVHPEFLERQHLPETARGTDVWKRRYREINDWERYLTDNGFRIVKLFLNVSKEEQRRRFLARIDEPAKNWKFSADDARERRFWDEYEHAISEMLSHTSTACAPWHVVPADRKWFMRVAVAATIVKTLMDIDPQYPTLDETARAELLAAKAELEAETAPGGARREPS